MRGCDGVEHAFGDCYFGKGNCVPYVSVNVRLGFF